MKKLFFILITTIISLSFTGCEPYNDPTPHCVICHQDGHTYKECPERRCANCGGKGHDSNDCPNKNNGGSIPDEGKAIVNGQVVIINSGHHYDPDGNPID